VILKASLNVLGIFRLDRLWRAKIVFMKVWILPLDVCTGCVSPQRWLSVVYLTLDRSSWSVSTSFGSKDPVCDVLKRSINRVGNWSTSCILCLHLVCLELQEVNHSLRTGMRVPSCKGSVSDQIARCGIDPNLDKLLIFAFLMAPYLDHHLP